MTSYWKVIVKKPFASCDAIPLGEIVLTGLPARINIDSTQTITVPILMQLDDAGVTWGKICGLGPDEEATVSLVDAPPFVTLVNNVVTIAPLLTHITEEKLWTFKIKRVYPNRAVDHLQTVSFTVPYCKISTIAGVAPAG